MRRFPLRIPRRATARRGARRLFVCTLLLAAALGFSPLDVAADQTSDSDRLKAGFLYRLAKFVTWPESEPVPNETPMVFCVLARQSFGETLLEVLGERTVHGRPLRVSQLTASDELDGCHLLFVGALQMDHFDSVRTLLEARPVLTIGEVPDFASRGGMINFTERAGKLQFEINRSAIEASGLRPASQLLRLAAVVHTSGPKGTP